MNSPTQTRYSQRRRTEHSVFTDLQFGQISLGDMKGERGRLQFASLYISADYFLFYPILLI